MSVINNVIGSAIYPCDGSNIYVSKLFGSDSTGTGSQYSPLASWTAAIALANSLPGLAFQFYGLDGENYDELELDFPNASYVFAPNANFSCSTGDTLKLTAFVNFTCDILQSTGGLSVNMTGGFSVLNFQANFAGDFSITTNTLTINANTIFGNIINSGGAKTVLKLDTPIVGTADANCFAPWGNSLTPIS